MGSGRKRPETFLGNLTEALDQACVERDEALAALEEARADLETLRRRDEMRLKAVEDLFDFTNVRHRLVAMDLGIPSNVVLNRTVKAEERARAAKHNQ